MIYKNQTLKNQNGFAHIALLIIVILVAITVMFVASRVFTRNSHPDNPASSFISKITNSNRDDSQSSRWLEDCESEKRKPMTHLPMNIGDVSTISPYGLTAGAHVTPIDHLYFYPKKSVRDQYPVYAMADGYIVEVSSRGVMVDTGEVRAPEYRIIFQHSCQTISYFDLLTKLDDSILKLIGELKPNDSKSKLRIPVRAGQEIGRIGGQSLDAAIYNFSMTLPGFISPEMYEAEFWKVHTDDFFSYFSQSHQDAMQVLNRRKTKPYSGKIDYDMPGKLIGNWFKEGTNGYAGPEESRGQPGNNGYWTGHLAIFYDAIQPETIIVSLGSYKGKPKSFGVKNNAPDPAIIGVQEGVIKYELVNAPNSFASNENLRTYVEATVLFQVLNGEKLKMEVFPGKTASQVEGFTSEVLTYER